MSFAHSENSRGQKHELTTHLQEVAKLTSEFAKEFGAAELGHWAGLWHDLGKFHPDFQAYLSKPTAARGPDHKGAGAVIAGRYAEPLAFLVAGHHGGLKDREDLKVWLHDRASEPRTQEALRVAQAEFPSIAPPSALSLPPWLRSKTDVEFFLRMLFGAH